jgi:DNA-binding response OmpR family regulator
MSTLLIVEADAEIAYLYRALFRLHQIFVCPDTRAAIEFLHYHRPDLVITDIPLPPGRALRFLNYIRLQSAMWHIPVIGVSTDELVQHRAHTMGLDAFLPKPLNIPHLLSTVLHLLNREKSAGNSRMQEALDEYLDAYQRVYGRYPNLRWVGSYIMLGKERLDEARLKAETRRLHDQRAERENQALAET